jgi:hypothetical protein
MLFANFQFVLEYIGINFYKIYTAYFVPLCVLIPIIIFIPKYKIAVTEYKILFGYLIISACINVAGIVIGLRHQSNLWLFHVDTVAESVLLLFFFQKLANNSTVKKIIAVLLLLFPLACIVNLLLFQAGSKINTYPRAAESVLFILLTIYYWLQRSYETETMEWLQHPVNWILSGMLLYFSSSFCLFVFSNYLLDDAMSRHDFNLLRAVWSVHATLLLIMYMLFSVGFKKITDK